MMTNTDVAALLVSERIHDLELTAATQRRVRLARYGRRTRRARATPDSG